MICLYPVFWCSFWCLRHAFYLALATFIGWYGGRRNFQDSFQPDSDLTGICFLRLLGRTKYLQDSAHSSRNLSVFLSSAMSFFVEPGPLLGRGWVLPNRWHPAHFLSDCFSFSIVVYKCRLVLVFLVIITQGSTGSLDFVLSLLCLLSPCRNRWEFPQSLKAVGLLLNLVLVCI